MLDEKCPNCSSDEYEVDIFWDDFNGFGENDGVRVWECICSSCHKRFNIVYEYKCTRKFVEVSEG